MLGPSPGTALVRVLGVLPVITMSFVCHYNVLPLVRSWRAVGGAGRGGLVLARVVEEITEQRGLREAWWPLLLPGATCKRLATPLRQAAGGAPRLLPSHSHPTQT